MAGRLYIIDPDAASGQAVIGSYAVPAGATDIAVAGPHVYLASWGDLEIVDTTDPQQPAFVARVQVASDAEWEDTGIGNVVWAGGYVYATQGRSIFAVDVRDPSRPIVVGSFWTWDMGTTKPIDLASDGTTCYAACQDSGVLLLRVEGGRTPGR